MNATLADLTALLARVEAAEGPDRELGALVCVATGYATAINPKSPQFVRIPSEDADLFTRAPDITTSLNAALALCERVLPDHWRAVIEGRRGWRGYVDPKDPNAGQCEGALHKSPALALLAAMLKAKIAETTHIGGRDDG